MTEATAIRESIELVPFSGGPRWRCVSEPVHARVRGSILLAPAFAEEMNKTRRMCARLARMLAADGWKVVRLDLYGCGDSAGEFRDASWARWVDDLRLEARRTSADATRPFWLWCVRAGALFAPAVLEAAPGANMLLWQPVTTGAAHLQQFLRLSMAAGLLSSRKAQAVALTPSQQLEAGETVEVGGYELSPAVASGLRAARLQLDVSDGGRVVWLEVSPHDIQGYSPAAVRAVDGLRASGWQVALEQVQGEPFWQTSEAVENESLLQRSRALLQAASGVSPRFESDAS